MLYTVEVNEYGTKWFLVGTESDHRVEGHSYYYIEGKQVSQAEFFQRTSTNLPTLNGKLIYIDGKKYELKEVPL